MVSHVGSIKKENRVSPFVSFSLLISLVTLTSLGFTDQKQRHPIFVCLKLCRVVCSWYNQLISVIIVSFYYSRIAETSDELVLEGRLLLFYGSGRDELESIVCLVSILK